MEEMTREEIESQIDKAARFIKRNMGALQRFSSILMKRKDVRLYLGIGDDSFTNHSIIVVKLMLKEVLEMTPEEWYTILRFKTAHECQHNMSTIASAFSSAIDRCVEIWNKKGEAEGLIFNQAKLQRLAHFIVNSLEDGRIENILIYHNPGLRKGQMWYRFLCWQEAETELLPEDKDIYTILNNVLSLATMGIYSYSFETVYAVRPEVVETVKKCEWFIKEGINARRCADIIRPATEIAKLCYPWVEQVVESITDEELKKALEQMAENAGLDTSEENHNQDSSNEQANDSPATEMSGPLKEMMDKVLEENPELAEKLKQQQQSPQETEKSTELASDEMREDESDTSSSDTSESNGDSGQEDSDSNNSSKPQEDGVDNDGSKHSETPNQPSESEKTKNSTLEGQNSLNEPNNASPQSKDSGTPMDGKATGTDSVTGEAGTLKDSLKDALKTAMKNKVTQLSEECKKEARKNITADATPKKTTKQLKEEANESSEITESGIEDVQSAYERDSGVKVPFEIRDNKPFRQGNVYNPQCRATGRQLARVIDKTFASKAQETQRQQRAGKLDVKSLAKVTYGAGDVFLKTGMPYEPDVCCYILKDGSGSMWSKVQYCCEALGGIEEAMKGKIPLRIVDFSEDEAVTHTVIKDWDESRKDFNYSWNFYENGGGADGCNFDGFSIRVATREILMRPESHKLLIVMSDGQPASCFCNSSFSQTDVRNAVEEARKAGVYVVSIFFGSEDFIESEKDSYAYMYEKNFFGATPENLVSELSRHLKKFIRAY